MRKGELELGPHGRNLAVIDREIGEKFSQLCEAEAQLKALSGGIKEIIKECSQALEQFLHRA